MESAIDYESRPNSSLFWANSNPTHQQFRSFSREETPGNDFGFDFTDSEDTYALQLDLKLSHTLQ